MLQQPKIAVYDGTKRYHNDQFLNAEECFGVFFNNLFIQHPNASIARFTDGVPIRFLIDIDLDLGGGFYVFVIILSQHCNMDTVRKIVEDYGWTTYPLAHEGELA